MYLLGNLRLLSRWPLITFCPPLPPFFPKRVFIGCSWQQPGIAFSSDEGWYSPNSSKNHTKSILKPNYSRCNVCKNPLSRGASPHKRPVCRPDDSELPNLGAPTGRDAGSPFTCSQARWSISRRVRNSLPPLFC